MSDEFNRVLYYFNLKSRKPEPVKKGVWGSVKEWTDEHPKVVFGLKVAGVAAVGIVAAPAVLGAAGFGAGGVGAGSAAAWVQSAWFGAAITGKTGLAFSACQSAAMAGLPVAAKGVIVAGSAVVVKAVDSVVGSSEEKGAGGVAAGSGAAYVQGAWFEAPITENTGVVFSACQRLGAAGLTVAAKAGIVAGNAVVKAYDSVFGSSKEKDNDCSKK